jgi:[ribosomal protein S18]-alanine N-acetyltransferase
MGNCRDIELRRVDSSWGKPLEDFFCVLDREGIQRHFHPHPLTEEEARKRVLYDGPDLYYLLVDNRKVIGYGMLRGWEEGFDTPNLGIILHPEYRGLGLGEMFMHFLHSAARYRGANRVRLKVYPENESALRLYQKIGYQFTDKEEEQLVGWIAVE